MDGAQGAGSNGLIAPPQRANNRPGAECQGTVRRLGLLVGMETVFCGAPGWSGHNREGSEDAPPKRVEFGWGEARRNAVQIGAEGLAAAFLELAEGFVFSYWGARRSDVLYAGIARFGIRWARRGRGDVG